MSTAVKLFTVMKAGPMVGETDEQWGLRVFEAAKAADTNQVNVNKFKDLSGGLPVDTGITYDRKLTSAELKVLDGDHNQQCANTLKKNQTVRRTVVTAILGAAAGMSGGGGGAVVAAVVPALLKLISDTVSKS